MSIRLKKKENERPNSLVVIPLQRTRTTLNVCTGMDTRLDTGKKKKKRARERGRKTKITQQGDRHGTPSSRTRVEAKKKRVRG